MKISFLEIRGYSMGSSPINKVFDFLIENDRTSWTMNEISEQGRIGYATLKLILPKMLTHELLIVDREIGKIKFYKLNKNNDLIKAVYKLHKVTEKMALEKFINN